MIVLLTAIIFFFIGRFSLKSNEEIIQKTKELSKKITQKNEKQKEDTLEPGFYKFGVIDKKEEEKKKRLRELIETGKIKP
jgi:hypothetical protein